MTIPVGFIAIWDDQAGRMLVTCELGGQKYAERFTARQWREYINKLDAAPLRLGGLVLEFKDEACPGDAAAGIKKYLRAVDDAFVHTGQTVRLRNRGNA